MLQSHGEFDTTTVVDMWHASGQKGKEVLRHFPRGSRLISRGQEVEKLLVVVDGPIRPIVLVDGIPCPERTIETSLIKKPPMITVIGASAFFQRQPSDRDYVALDRVSAYEIDSRALVTKYRERDPKTRQSAVWPTARALVCTSDMSEVLCEAIGGILGVDPKQGFSGYQYDKIFSAFPDYPKYAMETIYQMLVERDAGNSDPSVVLTPPHVAADRKLRR